MSLGSKVLKIKVGSKTVSPSGKVEKMTILTNPKSAIVKLNSRKNYSCPQRMITVSILEETK